jgi:hypothetical protein
VSRSPPIIFHYRSHPGRRLRPRDTGGRLPSRENTTDMSAGVALSSGGQAQPSLNADLTPVCFMTYLEPVTPKFNGPCSM